MDWYIVMETHRLSQFNKSNNITTCNVSTRVWRQQINNSHAPQLFDNTNNVTCTSLFSHVICSLDCGMIGAQLSGEDFSLLADLFFTKRPEVRWPCLLSFSNRFITMYVQGRNDWMITPSSLNTRVYLRQIKFMCLNLFKYSYLRAHPHLVKPVMSLVD